MSKNVQYAADALEHYQLKQSVIRNLMQPAEADTDRSGCGRENGPDRAGRKPAGKWQKSWNGAGFRAKNGTAGRKIEVTIRKYIRDRIDARRWSAFRRKRISSFLM